MSTPTFLTAFCLTCNEPRYRSIKALTIGVDKIDPSLFQPVSAEIPSPNGNGPALCYLCESQLRFVPDGTLTSPTAPVGRAQRRKALAENAANEPAEDEGYLPQTEPAPASPPESLPPGLVIELFRVGDDEKLLQVHDAGRALLFITDKRVVAIPSGR